MVVVESLKFYDEYTDAGGGGSDFLIGSVGDKQKAIAEINIHWETLNIRMIFNSSDKSITRQDLGSFIEDGFAKNDNITISNSASNNGSKTIKSVTDDVIIINEAVVSEDTTGVNIFGDTPITGLDFYYNLIENSAFQDFHSLFDLETNQKFNAGSLDASNTVTIHNFIPQTNSKSWIQNGATIRGVSFTEHQQKFEITHTFFITPFFLASQLKNLQNGIPPAPDYFKNSKALKYIFQFDGKIDNVNPNITHSSSRKGSTFIVPQRGATSWFNEFLNGFDPEYTFTSILYKDSNTLQVYNQIQFDKNVDVEIHIHSANGRFVNYDDIDGHHSGTPMLLNICYLPLNENDYINKRTDFQHNFIHDRKKIAIDNVSVNGEKFGTDLQQLTGITAIFIDANNCKILFTYKASEQVKTQILSKGIDNRNYLIWITPQQKSITTTEGSDRNAIICDVNSYFQNLDDASLFSIIDYIKFYEYPNLLNGEFKSDFKGWITDTIISQTQFKVKNGKILLSLSAKIEAIKGEINTPTRFTLMEKTYQPFPFVDENNIEQETFFENNEFNLSNENERNQSKLTRVPTLDTLGYTAYEFDWSFKLRHELWREVINSTPDFVNVNTEKWSIYSKKAGWTTTFSIYASVFDPVTSHVTNFQQTATIIIKDETDIINETTIIIQTFADSGTTDIETNIQNDETTRVKASVIGNFTSFPEGCDAYYGIFYIDIQGKGGYTEIDQTSTEEEPQPTSIWINKATLTKINNSLIEITADIDFSKLDIQIEKYLIFVRFGCVNKLERTFSDGELHQFSDSEQMLFSN